MSGPIWTALSHADWVLALAALLVGVLVVTGDQQENGSLAVAIPGRSTGRLPETSDLSTIVNRNRKSQLHTPAAIRTS